MTKITNHNLEEMLVLINFVIPVEKDIPLLAALTFLAHLVITGHLHRTVLSKGETRMGRRGRRKSLANDRETSLTERLLDAPRRWFPENQGRTVSSSFGFFTVQWGLKVGKNREGQEAKNPDYSS